MEENNNMNGRQFESSRFLVVYLEEDPGKHEQKKMRSGRVKIQQEASIIFIIF